MNSLLFRKHSYVLAVLFSFFLFSLAVFADDPILWKPVTPAELQMKTPLVEPDADAEAIFWEIRIDDKSNNKLKYKHYVRVKIFTERGREKFSKFDIPFFKSKKVEDVAARVIKPDGTIINLAAGDIFERELITVRKIKIKAKSFAVPGIEPGVIVEYQYSEEFKNDSAGGEKLYFQRDIPIQQVTYFIRPYNNSPLNFSYHNMPEMRFFKDDKGYYVGTKEKVPAFREEPLMPPDEEVRQWVGVSYRLYDSMGSWSSFGFRVSRGFDAATDPGKDVKQKALELIGGAAQESDKLRRLFDFAQTQIRNISYDPNLSDEQRTSVKNEKPSDTLKRGMGTAGDIDDLFASLAKAAGFRVNVLLSGNRSENFFSPENTSDLSKVHRAGVAVRTGDTWKFYNPGTPYMPFQMIDWYEEGSSSLVAGADGYNWTRPAITDYAVSRSIRTGKFKLSEDGTLTGSIRVEHNGHQATTRRREFILKSPTEREESLKASWKESISTAEFNGVSIENVNVSSKPYVYSFNVRIPNYAQKTGKRIFLQPGFFEYGTPPVFSSASRVYGIYFDYPWSEDDTIEIELPKGYTLDSADAPSRIADPENIGVHEVSMNYVKETNTLQYKRHFHFGGGGNINFPVNAYNPIKKMFDAFHKADTHAITLKQNNP